MIRITLKDGACREYAEPVAAGRVAADISPGLARTALAAEIDGNVRDLSAVIKNDCALKFLTFDDAGGRLAFRHTASHVLAQAVRRLYPEAKLAIGPAIDDGFYYDFDTPEPFTPDMLEALEAEMRKIVKENHALRRFTLPREKAIELMREKDEPYKVELIEALPDDAEISFYEQGEFTDLCAGPHLASTGPIKAIKLLSATGAYWHGDSNNKMLQRIYGTCFPKASMLEEYLHMLEEAKKRDHRKLGRELDLFDIYEEGPGFPFFLPKGMILYNLLVDYWREQHVKRGYQEIKTPMILNQDLWHRSGHWDHYKDNMYITKIDDADYAIKPMNCPGGMLVYKRKLHSYKDLPQRIGELGLVHRHELSGTLHGLMRVRCFTQDDAHIFMTPAQIQEELVGVIELMDAVYATFGFPFEVELSTRPENSMGEDEQWELATNALIHALESKGLEYTVNEGDGAFYGPKIDFHLRDSMGRTWQCGTIQLDFQMPERFDLTYVDADGARRRPVMIHRVVFGSIERFIAILTEHFAGAFPLWLSPVQVAVLPISDAFQPYAREVRQRLLDAGLRCELDGRSEKIGYKIREAQLQKTPYMLIVGQKEQESGTVAVRSRSEGDLGAMTADAFIEKAQAEIASKSYSL